MPETPGALLLAARRIQGLPVVDELSWHLALGDLSLVEEDLAVLAARAIGHVHLDVATVLRSVGLEIAASDDHVAAERSVMLLSAASLEPSLLTGLRCGADVTTTSLLLTVLIGVVELLSVLDDVDPMTVLATLSLEIA